MTVEEVLVATRRAGIILEAEGDRLIVDAPVGSLTPELREALARQKWVLLVSVARPRAYWTPQYPDARTGIRPTVPIEAVELLIDLERRGYSQSLDAQGQYRIEPGEGLSDRDSAMIVRWRQHLATILAYEAPTPSGVQ
jgi:hypothetical protein